jgi:hypothetical protein
VVSQLFCLDSSRLSHDVHAMGLCFVFADECHDHAYILEQLQFGRTDLDACSGWLRHTTYKKELNDLLNHSAFMKTEVFKHLLCEAIFVCLALSVDFSI